VTDGRSSLDRKTPSVLVWSHGARSFEREQEACFQVMRALRLFSLVPLILALSWAGRGLAQTTDSTRAPNIILVIGDDHGWPYFGFMGDDIVQTPNLDQLAAEGTVFRHGFSTSSVCRPAHRTLISGLHSVTWAAHRENVEAALGRELRSPTELAHFQTLPRQLSRRGYRSFQGGKHWEGTFEMTGFDEGTHPNIDDCPDMRLSCLKLFWNEFGRVDLSALWDFLSGVGDEPFFVWFSPTLPHAPMDPPVELRLNYYLRGLGLTMPAILYYANITRFDSLVGDLLEFLDDRDLRHNTLLIYVSDNGYQQDPFDTYELNAGIGGPKGKVTIYELGFRTPIIFRWPGHIPAGVALDDLVSLEDVYLTALDYAGVTPPPDRRGSSLRPRLQGTGGPVRDRVIGRVDVHQIDPSNLPVPGLGLKPEEAFFLRTSEWRYVWFVDRDREELYAIDVDPFENTDLAAQYPELLESFRGQVEAWFDELTSPREQMEVAGRMVSSAGLPVPLAHLLLTGRTSAGRAVRSMTVTAENGSFLFPNVSAGRYELRARGHIGLLTYDGEQTRAISLDLRQSVTGPYLSLQADSPRELSPIETSSELAARIHTQSGVPVAGSRVLLRGRSDAGPRVTWLDWTDSQGVFRADALPAGSYAVWFDAPGGYRRPPVTRVRLADQEVRTLDLVTPNRSCRFSWLGGLPCHSNTPSRRH